MSTSLTFGQIAVDCRDAAALAGFWSALLELPVDEGASAEFAEIAPGRGFPGLLFARVPDDLTAKNRLHLDLAALEWRPEVERALGLGATRVGEFAEFGTEWATLADPEGNVFDIGLPHR